MKPRGIGRAGLGVGRGFEQKRFQRHVGCNALMGGLQHAFMPIGLKGAFAGFDLVVTDQRAVMPHGGCGALIHEDLFANPDRIDHRQDAGEFAEGIGRAVACGPELRIVHDLELVLGQPGDERRQSGAGRGRQHRGDRAIARKACRVHDIEPGQRGLQDGNPFFLAEVGILVHQLLGRGVRAIGQHRNTLGRVVGRVHAFQRHRRASEQNVARARHVIGIGLGADQPFGVARFCHILPHALVRPVLYRICAKAARWLNPAALRHPAPAPRTCSAPC